MTKPIQACRLASVAIIQRAWVIQERRPTGQLLEKIKVRYFRRPRLQDKVMMHADEGKPSSKTGTT